MGELICAGRPILDAHDNIRRYCGLSWSGGEPESWAYDYFDTVPTGPGDLPGPPDLLAAAALQPGFGRPEMAFFNDGGAVACERWLVPLPSDLDLADADEGVLSHLATLSEVADEKWLSILSKVAHHKRPRLVPLFDRAIADWYRPATGQRGIAAWPALVRAMHADLAASDNRRWLAGVREELALELSGVVPSDLRLMDIGIWMSGRGE